MNAYFNLDNMFDAAGDGHGLSIPLALVFLLAIIAVGVLSSRLVRSKSLQVKHLFLKANIDVNDVVQNGYIRTLDMHGASLVMNQKPTRGRVVNLDLGQLPNFPKSPFKLEAFVKSVKSLGGQPTNFVVNLKYKPLESGTDAVLSSYLQTLSR